MKIIHKDNTKKKKVAKIKNKTSKGNGYYLSFLIN